MEADGFREKKTRLRGDIFHLCVLSVFIFRRAGLHRNIETSRRNSRLTKAYIIYIYRMYAFQFSSVAQLCLTFWDPMDYSVPGFPVHHPLLELAQTHTHWVSDAIQPSHPLLSPSPPATNPSQHQIFQWVNSLHEVAKVLEFQLQHQSFPRTPRTDLP